MSLLRRILSCEAIFAVQMIQGKSGKGAHFDGGTQCMWEQVEIAFGGANNRGLARWLPGTNPIPGIFQCQIQEGESKFLRMSVKKKDGIQILHANDEMVFFMGQGMQCDEGQTLDENQFIQKARLGELQPDQPSWTTNNIKLNDIIVWC